MKPQYNRPVEILDHTKYIHLILGKWIEQLQEYIFDNKDYISQEAYLYFFDDVQEYYKYYNLTNSYFWNAYKTDKRDTIKEVIKAVNNAHLNLKRYLLNYNKSYEYILDQLELIKYIIDFSKEHHFPELRYSKYKQINPRHKSRLHNLVYFSFDNMRISPEDTIF